MRGPTQKRRHKHREIVNCKVGIFRNAGRDQHHPGSGDTSNKSSSHMRDTSFCCIHGFSMGEITELPAINKYANGFRKF